MTADKKKQHVVSSEILKELKPIGAIKAQMASERISLNVLIKAFVKKFCPYKIGDRLRFKMATHEKPHWGIITDIHLSNEIGNEGLDGLWIIRVGETTKAYKDLPQERYYNIGENDNDQILESDGQATAAPKRRARR